MLSDDFDLSKLELTQKQLSLLQDSELRTKILGSEGQAVLTDAVWVLVSVFVLCVFLMIVLLKKLISLKWAIIITVFLAPFVSAMACYGLLILTLAGKGNMPIMLGFVMLAAGVLWIALRILKYVKDKALRNSIEKQAFSMRDKLANTLEELKELSIQQITAINQEYFDKYGEEIERYEDSNCIVNEIFSSNEP